MISYTPPGQRDWTSLWSPGWMRVLTTAPLILYPLGCIVRLVNDPATSPVWLWIAGLGPLLAALACCVLIAPSQIQRITAEAQSELDERELELRRRAMSVAYQSFAAIVLAALFYLQVASDAAANPASLFHGLWRPMLGDHWMAIFGGAFLYIVLLPSAYLAWTTTPPPADDEA